MITLYRHQQVALNYLRFNDSFMLCMEQGTGKTIPTLVRILELFRDRKIETCLVVCPKSVIGSWQRDIEKFSPIDQKHLNKICLINYDKVWRGDKYLKQWDCLVLDEAHCIKNRTSKRGAFLLNLSINAKYRYLLTGTPISNGQLENLWSLICFLNPYKKGRQICSKIFAERIGGTGSYYEWLDKFAYLDQFHKPYKYHNIKECQEIWYDYCFRVTKVQCLDLPQKLPDEVITVELAPSAKKLYKDIATKSASIEADFVADNPLVKLTKLRQIASGFFVSDTLDGDFPCEKETALKEFLESYDKKLVIFAEYKRSIKKICQILTDRGINYCVLDGEQKDKMVWRKFQSDESIRVIVCQYQSGCQGIDLFASDCILYYEPTLRSNVLEQSRDRIHRNGQHNPCSYIHFLTKGTIEMDIYRALSNFSDFNEAMFTKYLKEYQRARR